MSFSHAHHHTYEHAQLAQLNLSFALASLIGMIFVVGEVIYAVKAHSASLLADAGHNFVDIIGLLISWGAVFLLKCQAREKYSYGYKKATILASLVNAILLFITCGVIFFEAVKQLMNPVAIHDAIVVVVALIGILVNGGSALFFTKAAKHDHNVRSAFLHLMSDALIALGVALTAVMIHFTNYQRLDPIVALFVGLFILKSSWGLLRHSFDLTIAAVPADINIKTVFNYLNQIPGVVTVHDLHIWGLSTRQTALTAHLVMSEPFLSDKDRYQIDQILFEQFNISHVTLQLEQADNTEYICMQATHC